jgi:MoxR-like ATPase
VGPHPAPPSPQRIASLIEQLSEGLVEREAVSRVLLLSVLAGEHVLLIGPPGTAKSEIARRLHRIVGGRWFERLLTRFTVPEELFGPMSLAALDAGRYERDIAGYLPDATVAFLDEVFRANSAILNALLTLLNERVFDQGPTRIPTPLLALVGASNEIPVDETLLAFADRFLLRCFVEPVSDQGFERLLQSDASAVGQAGSPECRLDEAELQAARDAGRSVCLPGEVFEELVRLRASLPDMGMTVSDRRWVRCVAMLKVAAAASGRYRLGLEDLLLLAFVLPSTAAQARSIEQWTLARLGADAPVDPQRALRIVEAFEKQSGLEQAGTELAFDDSGKLALMRGLGGADDDAISGAAPRMSAFSRRRLYSSTHIQARLAQIDEAISQIDAFAVDADRHRQRMAGQLQANPWLAPALVVRALGVLALTTDRIVALAGRLRDARQVFASLPLAPADDGKAPAPVVPDD